MSSAAPATPGLEQDVTLEITGMTCASCAMRIEKKLNKLEGVSASVNYATEKAAVRIPAGVAPRGSCIGGLPRGTPATTRSG
jgi:Cu+-exporting ATPase